MFVYTPAPNTMPGKQGTELFRNETLFSFLLKNVLGSSCDLEGGFKTFKTYSGNSLTSTSSQ